MFDVFISYKHSEEGRLTKDYQIAQQLFGEMRRRGICAFLSDESIFSLGRCDYKKAIDNALGESTVLVVVGTSIDHLTNGWVEYEYETFHEDILSGRKSNGALLSYTKDIDYKTLPRTLTRYQNFQVGEADESKVVDFIERVLNAHGTPELKAKAVMEEDIAEIGNDSGRNQRQKKEKSSYASDYRNELDRLKIQANNARRTDHTVLNYVFKQQQWDAEVLINVLDLGSAYGFVAYDRFAIDPRVGKVICVDNNRRVIERARVLFAEHEKMIFAELDIEKGTFAEELRDLLQYYGIEDLHIVFSALTLHHLKDPNRALRQIRKVMGNGSWIVLRGSDDGSKLCYPKSELMEAIIEKSSEARGASDRFNGRKLFTQLSNSGFTDIRIFSDMTDLSALGFDERAELFEESFAYRANYFRRLLEENPENVEVKEDLRWMENALEEFENQFFESNFWYCEYDYAAAAKKR